MWIFSKLPEGEPERNPRESEFFNVGDLDPSASLVREIIQNTLDARKLGNDKVSVRFNFGNHSYSDKGKYYDELIPHLISSEMIPAEYSFGETIPFLTIEDFGTNGLDGPVSRAEITGGVKSNYYDFWWREGKSNKEGQDAGRWGLGKTVFFSASSLRSFWGLTHRQDDQQVLLLGKSVMKTHRHTDGETYKYFSYFAEEGSKPIKSKELLDDFRSTFALTRGNEPGLSIVIPAPLEITPEAIIRSVIIHYFFPIMRNMLVVEVNHDSSKIKLDSSTLCDISLKQDWIDTAWKDRAVDSLMSFLDNAATKSPTEMISLEKPHSIPRMTESLFVNKLEESKKLFADNELLWIRVPVDIQKTGEAPAESYFDVYLQKDEGLNQADEFYIRSGITISEIKMLGNRRVRALLFIEDNTASTFLGDSESPAHTDWKERGEDFKKKYPYSRDTLRFIRSSMRDLVKILDQPSPGLHPDFLQDIFFISDETKSGDDKGKPPPPLPPSSQIFTINRIQGGCRISLSDNQVPVPLQATVRIAYDVIRGSPFSNYHPFDFNLGNKPIEPTVEGGKIISTNENELSIEIDSRDFEFKITGFDERRDLVVDIREEKI